MSSCLRYATLKTGDTLGLLEYQVLTDDPDDPDKEIPFDITGSTITIRMCRADDDTVIIIDDKAGFVADGPLGVAAYQRVAADVLIAALMIIEWTIVTPTGFVHESPDIQMLIIPAKP